MTDDDKLADALDYLENSDIADIRRHAATLRHRIEALKQPAPDALQTAAQAVIDRMSGTYRARNGKQVGIEADDGEKCWIVHSDEITALDAALKGERP